MARQAGAYDKMHVKQQDTPVFRCKLWGTSIGTTGIPSNAAASAFIPYSFVRLGKWIDRISLIRCTPRYVFRGLDSEAHAWIHHESVSESNSSRVTQNREILAIKGPSKIEGRRDLLFPTNNMPPAKSTSPPSIKDGDWTSTVWTPRLVSVSLTTATSPLLEGAPWIQTTLLMFACIPD